MIFYEDRWPPRIIGYAFSRSCSCARMTTPRGVRESGEMRGFYCKCEVILPHGPRFHAFDGADRSPFRSTSMFHTVVEWPLDFARWRCVPQTAARLTA